VSSGSIQIPWLALSCLLIASCQSAGAELYGAAHRSIRVHDPSTIVRSGDEYWLFCTGRGISTRWSKDLIHWESGPPVFSAPPSWTTDAVPGFKGHFWAPDVIRMQDRYLLYYSVSTWGKRTSAIGLATNAVLDTKDPRYAWVDQGPVIQTSEQDDYNAIDPGVVLDADERLWLVFGSFWSGIKLVELDRVTGKRLSAESTVYPLAHKDAIEAACIHRHGTNYYLFVNWGQCCRGTNSTYEIRAGRSSDITGPYRDRQGVDLLSGGGTSVLGTSGSLIGPGHAGMMNAGETEWFSFHFYDGKQNGAATLGLAPLSWDAAGWPVVNP
jgi:arabinan endo-1,5-alpha-L-arabinosidase